VMFSHDGVFWGTKKVVPLETAFRGPAVASQGDRLYIAWAGTDGNHTLNVMASPDWGHTWYHKMMLTHKCATSPDLHTKGDGRLLVSWVGLESRKIHVAASDSGFKNVVTFDEVSDCVPQLVEAYDFRGVDVVWKATTAVKHLCIMPVQI